jgi:hypothetical protein
MLHHPHGLLSHFQLEKPLAMFLKLFCQISNSAYVDCKTFLSRLNIAGPKPG